MNETPLKQPKTPAPGTVAARVRQTVTRLNLSELRAAAYLGVPVFTYRKWCTGEREPGAAVSRLLDVLGMVEAMAPALHGGFLPPEIGHVKKSRGGKSTPLTP
jgi:DNA-binding transcriptional regulator YiaG